MSQRLIDLAIVAALVGAALLWNSLFPDRGDEELFRRLDEMILLSAHAEDTYVTPAQAAALDRRIEQIQQANREAEAEAAAAAATTQTENPR